MIFPIHTWIAERTGLGKDLNERTLKQWQGKKLKTLLRYAKKNSRFYSERVHEDCALEDLPFTSPSDIVTGPLAFLAIPQNLVARVTTLANSGTTRLRKRIFFSKADLERTVDFFAAGMSSMVSKGDHVQILVSNRTENSLGSLLQESLRRTGVSAEIPGVLKSAEHAIEKARSADCLVGMPAELLYMCRTAPELRPKSVLLAADYIPQSVVDSIKAAWKCEVFSHYGHTEFGYGCAVDCGQHNGYHLRDADLVFEIINTVNGKPAIPGEKGELVITTLSNEAMPLIRYRTGHISRFIHEPCDCGSLLPRLGTIEGHTENNIPVGGGHSLSIHQLDEMILALPRVRGFDASLRFKHEIPILSLTIDSSERPDLNTLAANLPPNVRLELNYGSADPFSRRGKRRIHISDL